MVTDYYSLFSAKYQFLETVAVEDVADFEVQLHRFFKDNYLMWLKN